MVSVTRDALQRIPHLPVLLSGAVVVVLWEALATQFTPSTFPGLVALAENVLVVVTNQGQYDFVDNAVISLVRITVGASISIALALCYGLAMGIRSDVEDYLSVPLFALLTFPSVFWAFLAVIWFGLHELLVPVFVIVVIVFPYLTTTIWEGTKDIDQDLLEMAHAFDADTLSIFRHVYLPHLQPYLYTSTRLGFALSWKLALVAEIFGTTSGIGVVVKNHFEAFQTDMVIAWAVPMMLLMFGLEQLIRRYERRASKWRSEVDADDTTEGLVA